MGQQGTSLRGVAHAPQPRPSPGAACADASTVTSTLLQPGDRLGSYEIIESIGSGGLGVVYRSRHVHLRRTVALKVLHPVWTSTPEFVERFREEGRVMAMLEHPNILRVYDAGEADGHFYLATQLLEGHPLEKLLKHAVPAPVAVSVARQIGQALEYAHSQGVVHRDVKPANVMVGLRGEVTLMDFGVARLMDSPGMTVPGIPVGTPYYMSPEQVVGKKADGRSDLYSLGVVLYQLLAGRLPFTGASSQEVYEAHLHREPEPLPDSCPAYLQVVVARMLAKSPEDRFPDMRSFLHALSSPDEVLATAARAPGPAGAEPPPSESLAGKATLLVREERTALSLVVVESARLKDPGLTVVATEQFAKFRAYVRGHLERWDCRDHAWSGDGLLALFVRPSQGAGCAVAILEGLGAFNEGRSGMDPIRVRIGVHHGPVLMAPDQPLGEVTSRTLDLAGHLQKRASENCALITPDVYESLPEQGGWEAMPSPGAILPGSVYEWCGPGAAGAPEETRAAPREPAEAAAARLEISTGLLIRTFEAAPATPEVLIGRTVLGSTRYPEIELGDDDAVSRRHARILRTEVGFCVEDLDSANGTRLNGEPLRPRHPHPLAPGDLLELGEATRIRVLSA